MNQRTLKSIISAMLAALTLAKMASGASLFNNESTFLAAAGQVVYEDFEDEPLVGTPYGSGRTSSLSFDFFTATSSKSILGVFGAAAAGNANVVPPGGTKYLAINGDFTTEMISLDFPALITGLGFYYRDINNSGPNLVQLTLSNGSVFSLNGTGDNNTLYFGLVGVAPFSKATLKTTISDSYWMLDGVASIPVPEGTGLTPVAIAGVVILRRRIRGKPQM